MGHWIKQTDFNYGHGGQGGLKTLKQMWDYFHKGLSYVEVMRGQNGKVGSILYYVLGKCSMNVQRIIILIIHKFNI